MKAMRASAVSTLQNAQLTDWGKLQKAVTQVLDISTARNDVSCKKYRMLERTATSE